jgi:UDP-N-acetylglucosamine 2-epimerase
MKIKILCIIGTRPEVIKMVPVVRELKFREEAFETVVCVTGQHREMVDSLLALFGIEPDHDLDVMQTNQTLGGLTAVLFSKLDALLQQEKPDWVLAQGDTTTVFVAATTAYYHKVKFGHVEAGLRTGNKHHPFPEEINRVFADHAADLLFAPTETSRENLLREGLPDSRIHVTGNTVVDTLQMSVALPYDWEAGPLAQIDRRRPVVLVTTHRRESFGDPMREVLEAIKTLALEFSTVQFVFPVHLNPNVRATVMDILQRVANVALMEPLDYLSLVNVMQTASLILTDSGGIQEEGASLGVPVLVMRETTERPEGLAGGFVELVGTDRDLLLTRARPHLLAGSLAKRRPEKSPYGDGRSAERIVNAIIPGEPSTSCQTSCA